MLISLITIVASLLIAAYFSAAESAVTSANEGALHAIEKNGNPRASLVIELQRNKDRVISTILLANNMLNIFASALTTSLLIDIFGNEGVIYATVIMTVLILLLGEILPKTLALKYPERTSLVVAPILHMLVTILQPITAGFRYVVHRILLWTGIDSKANVVSDIDVLRGTIDLHHSRGDVKKSERDMLGSILDLDTVTVASIMRHRKHVDMINLGMGMARILKKLASSPHSRFPVWKKSQQNIIGILHVRLIFEELAKKNFLPEQLDISKCLLPPWFIPGSTPILQQLTAFRERKKHFAVVVDEYGEMLGIITLEDILEEIVGQIDDENDRTISMIHRHDMQHYTVSGALSVRDFNKHFSTSLPDNEASTMAGLVMSITGTLPRLNKVVTINEIQIKVVKKQSNHITKLHVTFPRTAP